ncbi:MAG TPA: AAA family ATPase [Cyclobacteriaceae bacterium]|jgi:AAA15 family ATPase/GTPase|nr:AAA family ATPase [Cyclobacteriaceae bacterium]
MKISRVEIKNYRSIEDMTIDFEDYYTAICGKNNSGKSNILRAILNLVRTFRFSERINYSTDYPVWKPKSTKDPISLRFTISLTKEGDIGLIKFLNLIGSEGNQPKHTSEQIKDTILDIFFTIASKPQDSETEIRVNGGLVEDSFRIAEILRRIQTSQVLIFHNSTQIERRHRTNHGYLENLSSTTKNKIESKVRSIQRELSKVADKHKQELETLIGRFEDKYNVGLSYSGFEMDINQIPYEIYLGDKKYELPLEEWGSGTKNRTLIITSIFNAKKQIEIEDELNKITPIVVIEEPESFLHPLAQAEFGRVLQDLSKELKIQVIATTHSPYLLSHINPKSNILVKRRSSYNKLRDTYIEAIHEKNWREPFEHALGMIGPEFESLKKAFFSQENSLLFVEGEIDREYFELLRQTHHNDNKLNFQGQIYAYDGFGFLTNTILLKFIKNRFSNVIITLDMDTYDQVKPNLDRVGFVLDQDYFVIGLDQPGKRNIEGLLPESVVNKVNGENSGLIQALFSENKEEVKNAKSKLKKLYLDEFKKMAKPGREHFNEFYKVAKKINRGLVP